LPISRIILDNKNKINLLKEKENLKSKTKMKSVFQDKALMILRERLRKLIKEKSKILRTFWKRSII
jgi:hypothetical protein